MDRTRRSSRGRRSRSRSQDDRRHYRPASAIARTTPSLLTSWFAAVVSERQPIAVGVLLVVSAPEELKTEKLPSFCVSV